jgi:hypothetical protein
MGSGEILKALRKMLSVVGPGTEEKKSAQTDFDNGN